MQAQGGSPDRVGALLATLITPTGVDLRWPEVPGVDGYAISWRLSGADPSTALSVFSSNNQGRVESLQPSSTYVFEVATVRERVIQTGSVSAPMWASTLPQPPDSLSPVGADPFVPVRAGAPVATAITPTTVDLRWPAVVGAGGYVVAWWEASEERSDAKMLYAAGTSSTVTGLQPGTGYWIDVSYTRAKIVQSDYTSPSLRITTPGGSIGGGGGNGGGGVSPPPPPPPPQVPVVSVSGGSSVIEGGTAVFTITAVPAPSAPLTVDITVTQIGSFVAAGHRGAKQVTIPTSGSVTHSVPTIADTVIESNGSVAVTIDSAAGYNVAAPPDNTASVTVNDDDIPTVGVSGGSSVIEGGTAVFTITAVPAPSAPLTVDITVTQIGSFVAAGHRGAKQVTIPTSGSVTHSVPTIADTVIESNGSVAVTIDSAAGYNVAAPPDNTASVTVIDDDIPEVTPMVRVTAGSAVTEGTAATFTITAVPAPAVPLTVDITVTQSGSFVAAGHRGAKQVTIPTSGSVTHSVPTIADTVIESNGSVAVTIDSGAGYNVAAPPDNTASVTVNDDDIPTVGVSGGSSLIEGGTAVFTITAVPAPSAPLTVDITVTQIGSFVAAGHRGAKQVTIPTSGSVTHSVPTIADTVIESNGSVAVTIDSAAGYNVAAPPDNTASVTVKSDDLHPAPTGLTVSCNSGPVLVASWNALTVGGNAFTGGYEVRAKPFPGGRHDYWGVGVTGATSIRTGTDYWSRVNPKTGDVYYVSVRAVSPDAKSAWSTEVMANSCP